MIPFHSLFSELAQREVRCVHLGAAPDSASGPALPADEYAYLEFYCDDLDCDCRRDLHCSDGCDVSSSVIVRFL